MSNFEPGRSVVIFGASGYTGRLITAALAGAGIPLVLAGRDKTRLENLRQELGLENSPVVVADALNPASLRALFEQKPGVIINCVGPFTLYGEPVVKAALEAGVHYLDITGEQAYIARILDKYHELARQRGVAIVPGCGMEYAPGNWAAAAAADGLEPLEDLWVANLAGLGPGSISQGTALSALEVMRTPGIGWQNGRRVREMAGSSGRTVDFPPPIGPKRTLLAPFGEPVTLPRHIQVKNVRGYGVVGSGLYWLGRVSFPLLPFVGEVAQLTLKRFIKPGGPGEKKRQSARWVIVAEASGSRGSRRVVLEGNDVYGITARIMLYCAHMMLAADYTEKGALGPAQAFSFGPALEFLKENGIKVTVPEGNT